MNDDIKARMPKKPVMNKAGMVGAYIYETEFNSWYDCEIVPLFENARIVGAQSNDPVVWSVDPEDGLYMPWFYTAVLIGIKPIDHAVTKAEVIEALHSPDYKSNLKLADRIEKWGIKP